MQLVKWPVPACFIEYQPTCIAFLNFRGSARSCARAFGRADGGARALVTTSEARQGFFDAMNPHDPTVFPPPVRPSSDSHIPIYSHHAPIGSMDTSLFLTLGLPGLFRFHVEASSLSRPSTRPPPCHFRDNSP